MGGGGKPPFPCTRINLKWMYVACSLCRTDQHDTQLQPNIIVRAPPFLTKAHNTAASTSCTAPHSSAAPRRGSQPPKMAGGREGIEIRATGAQCGREGRIASLHRACVVPQRTRRVMCFPAQLPPYSAAVIRVHQPPPPYLSRGTIPGIK